MITHKPSGEDREEVKDELNLGQPTLTAVININQNYALVLSNLRLTQRELVNIDGISRRLIQTISKDDFKCIIPGDET